MANERCLQDIKGDCRGCNIQAILARRLTQAPPVDRDKITAGVQVEWCPPGNVPQEPEKKVVGGWGEPRRLVYRLEPVRMGA